MLPSFGTTPSPHPQFPYTITHKLIFPCVCASNIRLDDVFLTGVLAAKAGLVLVDIQVEPFDIYRYSFLIYRYI